MTVGTLNRADALPHGVMTEPVTPRWLQLLSQLWCELVGAQEAPPVQAERSTPRYRHPHTGQAWDGHGHQPQWLRDALLCEGWTVDDLRHAVKGPQAR